MIHHDLDLERMTGLSGPVGPMFYAHRRNLHLKGMDERILTLAEGLDCVNYRVPVAH